MMNNVSLNGRLTRDPELRFTPSGTAVCSFTMAVARDYKDDSGERPADFPGVVVWGQQAESVANYVKKGHMVGVTGRIETRNYENNEGVTVWVTEVKADQVYFMEPKQQDEPESPSRGQQSQRQGTNNRSRTTGNRTTGSRSTGNRNDPF